MMIHLLDLFILPYFKLFARFFHNPQYTPVNNTPVSFCYNKDNRLYNKKKRKLTNKIREIKNKELSLKEKFQKQKFEYRFPRIKKCQDFLNKYLF